MTNTQIETMKNSFILTDSEIGEIASGYKVPDDLFDTLIKSATEALKAESEVAERMTPLMKIQYLVDESFKYGVMNALYRFNESLKMSFDDMKKGSEE